MDTALSYVGTREATGHNDGPTVEKFLHSVGLKKGYAWCAAFVSYCLTAAHAKMPNTRSGMALSFYGRGSIPASRVLLGEKVPDGSIAIWRHGGGRSGHAGFVVHFKSSQDIETVEGNTSPSADIQKQFEGDGVYIKHRKIQPTNYFRIIGFTRVGY